MSILIAILIIKFFDLNMASNWIKYQIDNGVSFKSLVSTTMQKVDELRNALTFDNVSGDSNISGEVSNLEVQVGENVFQIDSENSGEQQVYETAVEE